MALGALRALRRLGRRVPGDVAVFGFDDAPFSACAEPSLSTVRQPVDTMAERMVAELTAQIAAGDAEPTHVVLDTELRTARLNVRPAPDMKFSPADQR